MISRKSKLRGSKWLHSGLTAAHALQDFSASSHNSNLPPISHIPASLLVHTTHKGAMQETLIRGYFAPENPLSEDPSTDDRWLLLLVPAKMCKTSSGQAYKVPVRSAARKAERRSWIEGTRVHVRSRCGRWAACAVCCGSSTAGLQLAPGPG
jgi:hypothetical protein